jgi:COP9 signalosome complex subunit 5
MGWYHSHPFDVGPHSNAFLSATDVSTQLLWQISEDAAGNPWLALVVDPLRGVAKGKPEIGAFRCYPTHYTPPKGLAPDGVSWDDERARNARWGESCISYHQLVRGGRARGWLHRLMSTKFPSITPSLTHPTPP